MEKSVPEFVQWSLERTSHPFHMWDGITSIPDTLTTVLTPEVQKSVQQAAASLTNARSIHFLGCGSSYFSGIAGTYTFNVVAGITAYAHDAWEFATYPPIGIGHSALVAISHTGGTPAVLDSVRIATKNGVPTIGLTDVSGSDLERRSEEHTSELQSHKLISYAVFCLFFNDTATTEIYTLSLHDALPI